MDMSQRPSVWNEASRTSQAWVVVASDTNGGIVKKIPTLFKRDPENMAHVLDEITPGCEWVIAGEGAPTRKYDGTCVMFDGSKWWARREVKKGKNPPPHFVQADFDDATGKTVGWEPVEQSSFANFHIQALHAATDFYHDWEQGTYELVGPKVNGNPEKRDGHCLVCHADAEQLEPPANYDLWTLSQWLLALHEKDGAEGVVWHHPDGRMAKLKAKDFR
jgi:hypothetical protein